MENNKNTFIPIVKLNAGVYNLHLKNGGITKAIELKEALESCLEKYTEDIKFIITWGEDFEIKKLSFVEKIKLLFKT